MSDEKLSPRAALEALGFTFRPTRKGRIDVVFPGAVGWWEDDATWPDSEGARRYLLQLREEAVPEAARVCEVVGRISATAPGGPVEAPGGAWTGDSASGSVRTPGRPLCGAGGGRE